MAENRRSAAAIPVPVPEFLFVLQPEFPMNALILAGEALRIANQNSGRELFWLAMRRDRKSTRLNSSHT